MSHRNVPIRGKKGARCIHSNKTKFDPARYKDLDQLPDKSHLAVMHSLCCRRCCEQLQWKVDFGKYQPLEKPRKCNKCSQKTVAIAYHHTCQECAKVHAVCAKCSRSPLKNGLWQKDGAVNEGVELSSEDEEEEVPVTAAAPREGDDIEVDTEGKPEKKDEEGVSKFAFVDDPVSDEEFAYLRGLDITRLKAHKRKLTAIKVSEERAAMKERERRAVLRRERKEKGDVVDEFDSDEEL